MSMTLGCGTWGGNSTSSNVTWEHLLNYTWVSYPIPSTRPSDIELFGSITGSVRYGGGQPAASFFSQPELQSLSPACCRNSAGDVQSWR
jgi:hypothetical protein